MATLTKLETARASEAAAGRRRRSFPISVTLAVSIGLLVTIAVASVTVIQWSTARRNTFDLVNVLAEMIVFDLEAEIVGHLAPAEAQADFIAGQIEAGVFDLEDKPRILDLLTGAIASTPQIAGIAIIDLQLQQTFVRRVDGRVERALNLDRRGEAEFETAFAEMREARQTYWGRLFVEPSGNTLINLRQPLFSDGAFAGMLGIGITVPVLSEIVAEAGDFFESTAFILYGRDRILAHPLLATGRVTSADGEPALPLSGFGDVVVSSLWNGRPAPGFESAAAQGVNVVQIEVGGEGYGALYKTIHDYGETPWIIGAWFLEDSSELERLQLSALAGLVMLLIAILAAILLGRFLARPIRALASNTSLVGELDLEHVKRLPPSRIREIDDQSRAFNTMLASLRSFETYVPRSLVRRLIRDGEDQAVTSLERELSLLFTDVVGFTPFSERMAATDVAAFLNEHFGLLGRCVEAEGGTIDKFIGDALMAFWGAPEHQDNTAVRACRAALAMARAVTEDNELRRAKGLEPVRVRIGIHTGPVVVGNIGAPGRINYTVVGDTVNAAQRLEGLGKQLDQGDEVTILISNATAERLDDGFALEPAGSFAVKGKSEDIAVYRLLEPQSVPGETM